MIRILFIAAIIYLSYRAITIFGRIIFRVGKAAGKNEPPARTPKKNSSERIDTSSAQNARFEDVDEV